MAIITTKSLQDKPITPLDWTGHPLKSGQEYAGGDERFKDGPIRAVEASPASVKASPTRRKRQGIPQTPEQRKAFGDRMRAYWRAKRGLPSVSEASTPGIGTQGSNSPALDASTPSESG